MDDAAVAAKRGLPYRYPGWETALGWFHRPKRIERSGRYWLTPAALYRKLDAEFHFDCDPCPYPLPKGHNALTMDWGISNYVNPPFRKDDAIGGNGPTAVVRRAIAEQKLGKTSYRVAGVRVRHPVAGGGCRDTAIGACAVPRCRCWRQRTASGEQCVLRSYADGNDHQSVLHLPGMPSDQRSASFLSSSALRSMIRRAILICRSYAGPCPNR